MSTAEDEMQAAIDADLSVPDGEDGSTTPVVDASGADGDVEDGNLRHLREKAKRTDALEWELATLKSGTGWLNERQTGVIRAELKATRQRPTPEAVTALVDEFGFRPPWTPEDIERAARERARSMKETRQ